MRTAAAAAPAPAPPGWRCNAGGPMSRQRSQKVRATVLGEGADGIGCPLVICAGLDFGGHDPMTLVSALMKRARIRDPEQLRARYAVPTDACLCHEWRDPSPLQVKTASTDEVLAQVLLLGLCTAHYFDPRRPLLLTRASLTRRLQLFAGRGFYA